MAGCIYDVWLHMLLTLCAILMLPVKADAGQRASTRRWHFCSPVLNEHRKTHNSSAPEVARPGLEAHGRIAAAGIKQPTRHDGTHAAQCKQQCCTTPKLCGHQ